MEIKKENDQTVEIVMSFEDLQTFGLTYNQIDYKNRATEDMIKKLMNVCGGIFSNGGAFKTLIEVFPAPRGGCVIYLTRLFSKDGSGEKGLVSFTENPGSSPYFKRYRIRNKQRPFIFKFKNSDHLLKGMNVFKKTFPKSVFGELFLFKGCYYLVATAGLTKRQRDVLDEYALCQQNTILLECMLREHGTPLL